MSDLTSAAIVDPIRGATGLESQADQRRRLAADRALQQAETEVRPVTSFVAGSAGNLLAPESIAAFAVGEGLARPLSQSVRSVNSAIPTVEEGFIGPTLDASRLIRTTADFRDAVGVKYQALYDQGYTDTMDLVRRGLVANDPTVIGSRVDSIARDGLRDWLSSKPVGIQEGPGRMIAVNRRLYDPFGSGAYRIPDVYIPSTQSVFDGSIGFKTSEWNQTIQFHDFSGGGNVIIVRPTQMLVPAGQPQGSYGLIFR
jgi:hypothetical protein